MFRPERPPPFLPLYGFLTNSGDPARTSVRPMHRRRRPRPQVVKDGAADLRTTPFSHLLLTGVAEIWATGKMRSRVCNKAASLHRMAR
jgi:hypothetical protein